MIIEMKMRLIIFSFFYVSILELRISADRFSRMPLFHHFYQKIDSNVHFDSLLSNIVRFSRKTINAVQFSKIKIRISIFLCIYDQNSLQKCVIKNGIQTKKKKKKKLKRLKIS